MRDVDSRQRDLGTAARKALAGDRPGELLEIEGVATALLVEDVDPFAYQLASLRLRQGAELHACERAGAMSSLERCCEPLGQLVRPDGHGNEHGSGRRAAQQRAEQLDRGRVRPVEVVEHEEEGPRVREELEERAHRAVRAVALVLQAAHRAAQDRRQLGQMIADQPLEPLGTQARAVLIGSQPVPVGLPEEP